jgi:RNA polymerase sigma factor (sigma-70 family)
MQVTNDFKIKQLVNLNKVPENLRDELQVEAKQQIDQVIQRLKRWPLDSSPALYLNVHNTDNLNQWETHIILTLPSEIISVQEKSWEGPLSSLKEGFGDLLSQLNRYVTEKRQSKNQQRKGIDKKGKKNIGSRLDQAVHDKEKNTFIFLLKPYLDGLRKIASREIRNLEIQEHLKIATVSIEDLINETLLRAWRDYRQRPKDTHLDQWLVQILFQIIKQITSKEKKLVPLSEALESNQMKDFSYEPNFDSDQWWWSKLEPTEGILVEDLLPGEEAPESLRYLTQDEENKRLTEALSLLSKDERQILSLFALDGYDISEIVKIMNMPIKRIKDTVENAKNKVREGLLKRY